MRDGAKNSVVNMTFLTKNWGRRRLRINEGFNFICSKLEMSENLSEEAASETAQPANVKGIQVFNGWKISES